nr:MAG TPA: hypothetical protein [Caudoviricetes sp.]
MAQKVNRFWVFPFHFTKGKIMRIKIILIIRKIRFFLSIKR